ncbi:transcriptional regulator [Streptomyces olivaceoviridis]|uniref:LCP family protein n=1 Tax=Streptomyces olivaceoviridis TaxID=1921 RepID=UPI001991B9BB|nr:LCP family protein [Streptomyces olivaceoviridis]GGZ06259.1 transcriptional regulator [Streptomyces olivaceoviridis]
MSDPWDGPAGQGTRSRGARVPRQRGAVPDDARPPGGRAAARAASRAGGGRRSRRARPVRRGRRVLKILGIGLSVLIVVTAGAGWWFYEHLNGNIHSVSLDGKGGTEKADAFGRTPINILVMGSDGRTSATDCKLGGGCAKTGVQTGSNADVEMVLHISADRSNATVMSIPRDTMTKVPACEDSESGQSTNGYYGQINSALQYGPACQVATVHQLTGITIDHFVKLDFSGVVKMSDAVGGVSVCVSDDVYDTYSHLKLSKGTHTLKGVAALEFVRSRHGFGDGSDLGRTVSQHIFLSAMIRKFKSAGTLTDPTAVYHLADAATKALTVDDGLGTVNKLISLADDVNKVPTKRITFTTMQTAPDPGDNDRVVVGPGAKSLFATIANDQALTTGSGKKSAAASATAKAKATASAVPAAEVAVTVENGTGITGRASALATALTGQGFSTATTTANAPSPATGTTLTYGTGEQAAAQTVAKALGLPPSHLKQGTGSGLTLVIGSDWPSGTSYPGGSSSPAPADTKAAVGGAHASTADQAKTCAKVSPYRTVTYEGVSMTPSQAYAAARSKPDSDA